MPLRVAIVEVTLADGAHLSQRVDNVRGTPENPMSREEIVTKAREAAAQERAQMLASLKREVGRLVVQTTSTVTGKILTADDQKRLAQETEKQLSA